MLRGVLFPFLYIQDSNSRSLIKGKAVSPLHDRISQVYGTSIGNNDVKHLTIRKKSDFCLSQNFQCKIILNYN